MKASPDPVPCVFIASLFGNDGFDLGGFANRCDVHKVTVQVRAPKGTFPGEVAIGHYVVVDGALVMRNVPAGGQRYAVITYPKGN
jgi:hypothetical protein